MVLALAQRPGAAARLHALGQAGLAHPRSAVAARRTALRALAPDAVHRDAVLRFAAAHRLRVQRLDDWSVTLAGPAAVLAPLFGTRLAAGDVVRAVSPPLVPPALLHDVSAVTGLDERPLLVPRAVPLGLTSATLRTQYGMSLAGSTGAGITVGTLNLTGWNPSDLTTYAASAGLALAPGQVTTVPVDNPPNPLAADGSGGDFEVAMDAETILAVAPAARQRMYFAPNNGQGSIDAFNQMAVDGANGLLQVASTSWGLCETRSPSDYRAQMGLAIDRMLAAGVTLFAAAGDAGIYDCSSLTAPDNTPAVDFPASYPNVVAVGGTRIGLPESAWGSIATNPGTSYAGNGGGGGASAAYPRPTWQSGLLPGSTRLVPDVASVGDPATGLGIYNGGWWLGGGTSLGAPTWAGLTAAALSAAGRTSGFGNILPTLYAHPEAFRDITTGSNGIAAGPGYDQATGLGVPVWSVLGPVLAGAPVVVPVAPADTVAPTTTVAARLLTGLNSQTRFTWAGHDPPPSSGVEHYAVTVAQIGGGTVLSTTTAATGTTLSLVPSRTYTLTVRATDVAGNTGPSASTRFTVPADQDVFRYTGSWVREGGTGDYRGTHHKSGTAKSTATAVVTGRTATLGVVTSSTGGYLDVYVDGRRTARLDLYTSSTMWRRQVRVGVWSTSSRHTVTLVVVGAHRAGSRGSNVWLDALTVTP
ncbi:MAG: hypothetical protein WCD35_09460 [Mycobacteriales bacterium]